MAAASVTTPRPAPSIPRTLERPPPAVAAGLVSCVFVIDSMDPPLVGQGMLHESGPLVGRAIQRRARPEGSARGGSARHRDADPAQQGCVARVAPNPVESPVGDKME